MTPPRISIALISAGALAYEVLLMRLFSIIQWHHFAYMIISLALLGYGASGTFLSLARLRLLAHFRQVYITNLLLFALSSISCFLLVQHLPFNPHEILWDPQQVLWLFVIYLVLALPFFFAANCIGLALSYFSSDVSRLYAADLFGAGVGSIAIVAMLFITFPDNALLVLSSLIGLAAVVAWLELDLRREHKSSKVIGVLSIAVILPWVLPANWTELVISPYKGVSQLLQVQDTRVINERSSPLGLITVVESSAIPLRHAPGLSLQAEQSPPEQLAVFTDGDGMTAITRHSADIQSLTYLDDLTSALPYHLNKPEHVLILGAGGGSNVLQAQYHAVNKIDAVELNPQIVDLLQNDYADFSGGLYKPLNSNIHITEARGFVSNTKELYDLIQISLLDSFSASSAGLYALSESYLYTVEALEQYITHLKPNGYLALSRWVKLPPRDTLKLFATAIQALESMNIESPEKRLVLIRSWQTSTLIIKNGNFTAEEINSLHRFSKPRAFDLVYYPGIKETEVNRYNILQQPYFFMGTQALLGEQREAFIYDYKFKLQPATDDKPYFFDFFKWRVVPEILSLRGQGGIPLLSMGYLILVGTLIQAIVASFILIIMPLLVMRGDIDTKNFRSAQLRSLVYFSALGLAFLFIEIAFIQKFILFLHHPLYAISVVLAAFLLFAGLGSAYSKRFVKSEHTYSATTGAVFAIVILGLVYVVFLETIFNSLFGAPTILKILISGILIAPLAFCMGMPFPMGLTRLSKTAANMIPWVWGVNGCASVISAVLATLLAIHFGFTAVVLIALCFYIIAAKVQP